MGLTTTTVAGSVRWMAPEQFEGQKVTVESDTWTYAMTVFVRPNPFVINTLSDLLRHSLKEIIANSSPYSDIHSDLLIIKAITSGKPPVWPNFPKANMLVHGANTLREICSRCWVLQPPLRPSMAIIKEEISRVKYGGPHQQH